MIDPTQPNGFQWTCAVCSKQFTVYDPNHVHSSATNPGEVFNALEAGHPTVILRVTDLPEFDEPFRKVLSEIGSSVYGLGNRWVIDWDRFYEMLESFHGYDMQDLGGPADNKIRRVVQKMVRDGEIQ